MLQQAAQAGVVHVFGGRGFLEQGEYLPVIQEGQDQLAQVVVFNTFGQLGQFSVGVFEITGTVDQGVATIPEGKRKGGSEKTRRLKMPARITCGQNRP